MSIERAAGKMAVVCDVCDACTDWIADFKGMEPWLVENYAVERVKSVQQKQAFANIGHRTVEHACLNCCIDAGLVETNKAFLPSLANGRGRIPLRGDRTHEKRQ